MAPTLGRRALVALQAVLEPSGRHRLPAAADSLYLPGVRHFRKGKLESQPYRST